MGRLDQVMTALDLECGHNRRQIIQDYESKVRKFERHRCLRALYNLAEEYEHNVPITEMIGAIKELK